MRELVLSASQLTELRTALLQDDRWERFAYVFCTSSGDRLLATEVRPVPDTELRLQSETVCGPTQAYERDELQECVEHGYLPLEVHSHPFSARAGFSGIDIRMMDDHTTWLHALEPDLDVAFGVLGQEGFEAIRFDAATEQFRDLPVNVLGNWTLDTPLPATTPTADIDDQLYDRAIRLVTEAGQRRLAAATVGVVGTGGLGFILTEQFARLGVQKLVLIDPDEVERSNLNRLPGVSTYDVGRPKVNVLAHQLHESGLGIDVLPVPEPVEEVADHLRECDIIVGAVDQVSTRGFLNQYAVQHLRYYLDAGSIIQTKDDHLTAVAGIVQLVVPGVNACYACLDRVDPEQARREHLTEAELQDEIDAGYIEESTVVPEPAIITLNGVVASLATAFVTRLVTGYAPPPDMVRYEELEWGLIPITTRRDPDCHTCGDNGILGQGDREPSNDGLDLTDAYAGQDLSSIEPEIDSGVRADGPQQSIPSYRRLVALLRQLRGAIPSHGEGEPEQRHQGRC